MKQALIDYLQTEQEVRRIVVFGAFLNSNEPQDMDVAAFQDGVEDYLPLALKYRRKTRAIAQRIALDILPLKMDSESDPFLAEVERGKSSMNDETRLWLSYVEENLESAELLLAHQLWNPCLQNAQQALEKFLKALLIESALPHFVPSEEVSRQCVQIVARTAVRVRQLLEPTSDIKQ